MKNKKEKIKDIIKTIGIPMVITIMVGLIFSLLFKTFDVEIEEIGSIIIAMIWVSLYEILRKLDIMEAKLRRKK